MTDEEISIKAAQAIGLKAQYSNNCGDLSIGEPYSRGEYRWNPLECSGLVFRLAVELRMQVDIEPNHVCVVMAGVFVDQEVISGDVEAAARRAITRAAAQACN